MTDRWPYCSMPAWFADELRQHISILDVLAPVGTTDEAIAQRRDEINTRAEAFWRAIMHRESFPKPGYADLHGREPTVPECECHGASLCVHGTDTWRCFRCQDEGRPSFFVRFDGEVVRTEEPS